MKNIVKNIYNYLDYREFIEDFYHAKKMEKPSYSFQVFANTAGFKSKGFISDVIDGKKNLSEESIFAFGKALELPEKEFTYFKNLVMFNQSKTRQQKDHFFQQLVEMNQLVKAKLILSDKYSFYAEWYHNTVREIVTWLDFNDDFSFLGRALSPKISARKAKQSVDLLLRLGLIKKNDNRYIQTDPDITTGDTVSSLAIEKFHLQNLNLAGASLDNCKSQERDISCIITTLSQKQFEGIKKEVQDFRKKLISIVNKPSQPKATDKRVYHINMQLFPTSDIVTQESEQ
jgi:uncharacterized protein (TIGR02147 family)